MTLGLGMLPYELLGGLYGKSDGNILNGIISLTKESFNAVILKARGLPIFDGPWLFFLNAFFFDNVFF